MTRRMVRPSDLIECYFGIGFALYGLKVGDETAPTIFIDPLNAFSQNLIACPHHRPLPSAIATLPIEKTLPRPAFRGFSAAATLSFALPCGEL